MTLKKPLKNNLYRLIRPLNAVLIGLCLFGNVWAEESDLASNLVKQTTERTLQALGQHRSELEAKPQLIYGVVNEIIIPHFDFERITQSAVGRFWREADAAQRELLMTEFRQLLVRTYAKALLNYTGQAVRILPLRPGNREGQVTVQTEVNEPGGPTVPIHYQMYLNDGAWKVYDVVIDGVSLVSNYRGSFAEEIRRGGLNGLIQSLKTRNQTGSK